MEEMILKENSLRLDIKVQINMYKQLKEELTKEPRFTYDFYCKAVALCRIREYIKSQIDTAWLLRKIHERVEKYDIYIFGITEKIEDVKRIFGKVIIICDKYANEKMCAYERCIISNNIIKNDRFRRVSKNCKYIFYTRGRMCLRIFKQKVICTLKKYDNSDYADKLSGIH